MLALYWRLDVHDGLRLVDVFLLLFDVVYFCFFTCYLFLFNVSLLDIDFLNAADIITTK